MSEAMYGAMRAYIDAAVELGVRKAMDEFRAAPVPEARAAEPVVGRDGAPGPQGVGIADVALTDGALVVRLSDGTERNVGRVVGERGPQGDPGVDGAPGKDGAPSTEPGPRGERGADGIATREELDQLIEARFADLQVRTFADIYREVFRSGETYNRSDVVTWGGHLWLAKAATTTQPGTSDAWKMIVKAGKDASRK